MKHLSHVAFAAPMLLLLLAGCGNQKQAAGPGGAGPAAPGGQIEIAFVTNNTSDYWTIARRGVEAAEKELPDTHVDFVMPADGTAATQKADVEDKIASGVKGIAISPVDPANQTDWLNSLVGQNVTVMTQDSDAPNSKRVCYIGTDNHAAGMQAGQEIKVALPQGGKIMLFVGKSDAQNAHDRISGIQDALKGSNIQILGVRTDDTDHARAKANAADAITSTPDLAAEVGIWSYNGPAILSAVQDAGKVGKIKIVCFDEEDDTLAGVKSGAISATIVQNPYKFGYDGIKMLHDIVKGDKSKVPTSGTDFIPTQAIKQDTVDAFKTNLDKLRGRKK